ncbi:hypothetical protein AGMMS50293_25630 [Spirochaetia bacterium]|nr:hypothetical protein AGMMS50293_25630 [Spirochaetia bacterium]
MECFLHNPHKVTAVLCALLLFSAVFAPVAYSQTVPGSELEALLNTGKITCSQAAYFVLAAALENPPETREAAFGMAREQGWLSAGAESPVTLGRLSLLIMKAFDLGGGLLYRLFPGPRYAYREMIGRGFIEGRAYSTLTVSGERFLHILGNVLVEAESRMADQQAAARQRELAAAQEREQQRFLAEEQSRQRKQVAADISAQLENMAVADTTVSIVEEGVSITLSDIQFLPDSAILADAEKIKLQEISRILRGVSGRNIIVFGHTAQAGTETGQIQVSRERAQAVAEYLVFLGTRRAEEVTVQAHGSSRPVADNNTAAGMALNRRVEIIIVGD